MCLGVPGKIVEIYERGGLKMAKVDFGGVFREACLDYVPDAKAGEYCIIHVGFAISVVSESVEYRGRVGSRIMSLRSNLL
ncbi:HypC/HybG/HupF family hydrogenase formation chaperone [Chloroflexi bacterium CFX6]|nr:HypC/HybG/HupF family hydrogenase formation chaperone [Chloroflexi bacterium CFX6]